MQASEKAPLLRHLLRDVSRSFYLTLRVLPSTIRDPIGLAYLLARATDTIADTGAVPVSDRLAALSELRARILGESQKTFRVPELQSQQSSPAERILLERINEALTLLFQMRVEDRERIQKVVQTISDGQRLDLERFGSASQENITALQSATELHDYTYRVAGCVGEFWTRMCLAHLSPTPVVSPETLVQDGIRFGKGLQLVNILRDIPADLRSGRCYLPWPALQLVNLQPRDLLDARNEAAFRPIYDEWLAIAQEHLEAGWRYVLALPFRWCRVRLACAWPILIGLKTLDHLRTGDVLNTDRRIKVSRGEVRAILLKSVLAYPSPALWKRLAH